MPQGTRLQRHRLPLLYHQGRTTAPHQHYNAHSIGICYEGGLDEKGKPADTRTPAQKRTLLALLKSLRVDFPDAEILGHRDLPWVKKACPCFDVREYQGI